VLPGQCCHTPEGAVIREHGKWLIHEQTEKSEKTWRKKSVSVPVHSP